MTTCPDCKSPLYERRQSKRIGELLLSCPNGHKWQGRMIHGFLHLYRTNRPSPNKRKVKTITVSPDEQALMDWHGLKQQAVYLIGIEELKKRN